MYNITCSSLEWLIVSVNLWSVCRSNGLACATCECVWCWTLNTCYARRSEEGDKELEKERERITPFITFQQVTTTSTNASSSNNVLPSTQTSESIVSKIVSTMTTTTVSRKEKLQAITTKESISSILPRSNVVEIAELPSAEEPSNAMSLITSPELLQSGAVELHHVNGDALIETPDMAVAETVPTISSSQVSTISLIQDVLDAGLDSSVHNPTSTTITTISPSLIQRSTRRDIIPTRKKRSYVEVDDIVVTSSAKRSIVPTAYITSYSPLHSPQLGSKQIWGTETATMIIDQHNNNG